MIKIEHNIPIKGIKVSRSKFPFKDMEVGDSFKVPKSKRSGALASACGYGARQEPEQKFTSKIVDDRNVRIWRIT